ncbi:MAG: 50S ribosomal protein L29 [Gemmatimonadales bacterium]|nr:50S ribosomal protein L29 [Gemmatimonadales bacterium]
MKSSELRELSVEQLQAKVAELREEAFRLRFRASTESIESPIRFRQVRRDVARILTILRERTRAAAGN